MIISPPAKEDYNEYYQTYTAKVEATDLIAGLRQELDSTISLFKGLDTKTLDYRYMQDKWSIKEVLIHVIDTERVFAYRALRFGRHDSATLAGMDQNVYGDHVRGTKREISSLLEEYRLVRLSTIKLFESFGEDDLDFIGIASEVPVTVRAIGYIILGHNIHHRQGIEENYLS